MKTKHILIPWIIAAIFIASIMLFSSCNYQVVDTTWSFEEAIIYLPNGEILEGKIESWRDYEGDQIQVKMDGRVYLLHSMNVVLISK